MKKPILCVFAHPDDEAFGPAGTICLEAKDRPISIICLTDGDAGKSHLTNDPTDLRLTRRDELRKSAKILGVSDVRFFGYNDGSLCNLLYHEIAEKMSRIVDEIRPDILLTYEHLGISGHLDHVFMSLVTSFVFEKNLIPTQLWYYGTLREKLLMYNDYFIYMPPGYDRSQFDVIVNIESVYRTKVRAMRAHASQRHDANRIIIRDRKFAKEECFIIVTRMDTPMRTKSKRR